MHCKKLKTAAVFASNSLKNEWLQGILGISTAHSISVTICFYFTIN